MLSFSTEWFCDNFFSLNFSIIEAGHARLRPIIMTTMTTVLGLLPMVVSFIGDQSAGAEIRAPMAITVIGGLLFSTFLTLVVVPVIYSVVTKDQIKEQSKEQPKETQYSDKPKQLV